ncbi:MAG: hypothetical protein FJ253_00535 [Phycisphaerae bacterium]|nr:hypothetical protein [Phycisphaerae bacterium]
MDPLHVESGECWVHLAFDAASAIDLERAESRLAEAHRVARASSDSAGASASRESISDSKRTPPGIQFRPKPLRLVRPAKPLAIGSSQRTTEPEVELTIYEFGAISVAYRVRIADASLEDLRRLTNDLADTSPMLRDARAQIDRVLGETGDAARRIRVADPIEDYLVLHLRSWRHGTAKDEMPPLASLAQETAQILRAADEPLSTAEIEDALACTISYGRRDLAIIDWNAAILFEPDPRSAADLLAVLEFANVELVELRFLDDRLDGILDAAYRALGSAGEGDGVPALVSSSLLPWRRGLDREHRRLAALQMDSALLFEGVNNAIKLIGDQFLARVYRLAAKRFHLAEWDAAILRKLETLQQLYEKASDARATRRMEILEWIIIILIALSIVIVFVPGTK